MTETPGTEIPFTVTGKSSTKDDPRAGSWTHSIRVIGEQTVSVPAGTYRAIVIQDTEQGIDGNSYHGIHTIWVDNSSGALLRWQTIGLSNGKNSMWETTSLGIP
jgi:DNA/RNA endonuclease G (NUC1)